MVTDAQTKGLACLAVAKCHDGMGLLPVFCGSKSVSRGECMHDSVVHMVEWSPSPDDSVVLEYISDYAA
jgi:hypothetical protein